MAKNCEENSEPQATKFVRDRKAYTVVEKIGLPEDGVTTFRATYAPPSSNKQHDVRIKIFELRRKNDIYELTNEIYNAELCCHHQHIEGVYCSFMVEDRLWVVMPWSNGEPLISALPRHGLSNRKVGHVLKQIVEAMDCIHSHHDHVHGNIDSCHVFVDENYLKVTVKFNSFIDRVTNVVETPSWMIDPALTANLHKGHDQKSDIWMIGLLALELFYGASDHEVLEYVVASIANPKKEAKHGHGFLQKFSCFSGDLIKKKLPESLRELVGLCLAVDPSKRPSTRELLNHKYFEGY